MFAYRAGAEIRELRRFLEVQVPHGLRILDHAGVVVVHAVDVGPDLDFLRLQGRANQGSRIVGAAALEVVHLVVRVPADEALRQEQLRLGILIDEFRQMLADEIAVRFSLDVGPHEIQRRQEHRVDALFLHIPEHQMRGQQLALREDHLLLHRAEELLGESAQEREDLMDEIPRLGGIFLRGIEFLDDFQVLPFQAADGVPRAFGIVVVQVPGNLNEGVRGARHRGQDDEIPAGGRDELRHMLHPGGGPYGGSAEFHDLHSDKFVSFLKTKIVILRDNRQEMAIFAQASVKKLSFSNHTSSVDSHS